MPRLPPGAHPPLAVEPQVHGPIVTTITPSSRDVAHGRAYDGRAVGAAEQRSVHEQREELPELAPLAMAVGERRGLVVGGEDPLRRSAEEPQHGQVDLAV